MEIKMNKEIRSYQEAVFWGLTLRQLLFGGAAVAASVFVYFKCGSLGTDMVSWLCILVATPFALAGFFQWHGMTAEVALLVILRALATPRRLPWRSVNYSQLYFQPVLEKVRKEDSHGFANAETD
ncbi:MAG TPA: PrgI family protein [Candidatus Faecousia intestinigallinarum]|nr:PrgI family protein [Candidatus Faecousia intestinigallinarum]